MTAATTSQLRGQVPGLEYRIALPEIGLPFGVDTYAAEFCLEQFVVLFALAVLLVPSFRTMKMDVQLLCFGK